MVFGQRVGYVRVSSVDATKKSLRKDFLNLFLVG